MLCSAMRMPVDFAVNVYGLDSYPGGLSCTNTESGFNVVTNYYQWFQNYSYTQPEFLPEFEGGQVLGQDPVVHR